MTRLFFLASGVSLLCLFILSMTPGPGTLALQVVPLGLSILFFRKLPQDAARNLFRTLRAEVVFDVIVMISLLSLIMIRGVVPAAFWRVLLTSVFLLACAVLGLMVARIIHFVTLGGGWAKRS